MVPLDFSGIVERRAERVRWRPKSQGREGEGVTI